MRSAQFVIAPFAILLMSCGLGLQSQQSDLSDVARMKGLSFLPASRSEQNILQSVLPEDRAGALRSTVLMQSGDRLAAAYWYESPEAMEYMQRVKEKVFRMISDDVEGLIDETEQMEGDDPITILAFTDRSRSEDRLIFAVIQSTLYEFHVADLNDEVILALLREIAQGGS